MRKSPTIKCVIVDRDGTLVKHVPYLSNPAEVRLLDSVIEGLRALLEVGCAVCLHTNQSGIGRGYFSMADVIACNREMLRQIDMGDSVFHDVCICPEAPGQEIYYRKPSPRYGLELASRHGFALDEMCYIGDNVTDLLAARNVGCDGVGVNTGEHDLNEMLHAAGLRDEYRIFDRFIDAARYVISLGAAGR